MMASLPPGISRSLTPGEKRIADVIFRGALDTSKVRIHNPAYRSYQGRKVAMTPNGEVWFRPEDYLPDFSLKVNEAGWLMHELTHAWQYQTGRHVQTRGAFEQATRFIGVNPYHYGKLDTTKAFTDYWNEEQGAIIEDYFRILQHQPPVNGSGSLDDYRAVIPFAPKPSKAAKPGPPKGPPR